MGLPLQSEMDMDNPREHFLWMFTKMLEKMGAALLLPRPFLEELSQHIYDCGGRHHPELQEKWYEPPSPDAGTWDQMAGKWVDHPPADPGSSSPESEAVRTVLEKIPPEMRAEILRQLSEDVEGGDRS